MLEFIQTHGWVVGILLAVLAALLLWLLLTNRKTRVITTKPDVLDEGAAPAKRNQALIDSPSAASTPGSVLGAAPAPKPARVMAPAPPPGPKPAAKAAPKPKAAPAPKPKAVPKSKAEPKPKAEPKSKTKPEPKPKPKAVPTAKAKPASKPVPKPKPASIAALALAPTPPPAPKVVTPDELTQIKGLGPKMAGLLGDLGVTSFAQVAAWSAADIARIDPQLGNFAGRIERDNFVEQAKLLAAGDIAGFEAKFGAL